MISPHSTLNQWFHHIPPSINDFTTFHRQSMISPHSTVNQWFHHIQPNSSPIMSPHSTINQSCPHIPPSIISSLNQTGHLTDSTFYQLTVPWGLGGNEGQKRQALDLWLQDKDTGQSTCGHPHALYTALHKVHLVIFWQLSEAFLSSNCDKTSQISDNQNLNILSWWR